MTFLQSILRSKITLSLLALGLLVIGGLLLAVANNGEAAGVGNGEDKGQVDLTKAVNEAAGIGDEANTQEEDADPPDRDRSGTGEDTGEVQVDSSVAYAIDPMDKRQLVGTASNVFVGRVVEDLGTERLETRGPTSGPQITGFEVEVLENIKGNLFGTVAVTQSGGYDEEAGQVVTPGGGNELLEPGQAYLLVTNHDPEGDRYGISAPPFGMVRIADVDRREAIVERFEEAANDQRVPDAISGGTLPLPEDLQ